VETAIAKLGNFKSPGSNQILAELNQAGGETLQPEGIMGSAGGVCCTNLQERQ
jgi:hypothetical protein